MSNNHKNCQFAEQIVSYLYDEFEAKEKLIFEAHLKGCRFCAEEYAGFGLVRSSILEWRDADFSTLTAPTFAITANDNDNFSPSASTESRSWLDQIRQMFSFSPTLAVTALAVAIVGVGLAFFALNFLGKKEIAEQRKEKDLVTATVSPTAEIKKKAESSADKTAELSTPPSSYNVNSPKEKKRVKPFETEKVALKVSAAAPKNNLNNTAVDPKETSNKKPSPVTKQRVPNLNELEQDEDETIRLADLFDELDTK